VGIWWSTILGLVLSAWAVRSPLHPADSNFGRIVTKDVSSRRVCFLIYWRKTSSTWLPQVPVITSTHHIEHIAAAGPAP
jgi:hypothetical protein